MRILWGASLWSSAWASVFTAMNSTPIISARIMRFTALLPPPPMPMTLMSAKCSASDRSGIGSLPGKAGCDRLNPSRFGFDRFYRSPTSGVADFFHTASRGYPQGSHRRWRTDSDVHTTKAVVPVAGRQSAGEQASQPVHHAPHPAGQRWAGRVADRLGAQVVGAPDQQADGRGEGGVTELIHQPAHSLRRADADGHLEHLSGELGCAVEARSTTSQDRSRGQHAPMPGSLHFLVDQLVDL